MNRNTQYFTLLVLSIVIASSLYLSWSVDRGLGDLIIDRHSIERLPGRPVEFIVYRPRYVTYEKPMPVVLTTHGVAGSKEGMYSFNIELARRNLTVVSVDLPGHGDSMLSFNITDFQTMAEDCYAALEFVQGRYNVDNDTYGVLTHSLGFQVAIQLADFPVAPSAYVAVGAVADMGLGAVTEFPGNFMIAIGEYDEMISTEDAIETLRIATGNESAVAGITYGNFTEQTAYKLAFAPTDHVFEAIDGTIVSESTIWMINALQGTEQLEHTLDPSQQVFIYKVFAMASGIFALLASCLPFMLIVINHLPEKLKPRKIENKTTAQPLKNLAIISAVLGTAFVLIFGATSSITFHFENAHIYWPNSMFATGLVLFFIIFTTFTTITLRIGVGIENTLNAYESAGIVKQPLLEYAKDLVKGLIPALLTITWLISWMAIGGLPEQMEPWIVFSMVRYPVGTRITNTIIIMLFAIPYYIADTTWIRGLLTAERDWGNNEFTKKLLLAVSFRLIFAGIWSVILVAVTTAMGFIVGSMVLLGLLLMLFFIVSALTTILIAWTSIEFHNPWPAIFVSAFIWAWVAISSIPLI